MAIRYPDECLAQNGVSLAHIGNGKEGSWPHGGYASQKGKLQNVGTTGKSKEPQAEVFGALGGSPKMS